MSEDSGTISSSSRIGHVFELELKRGGVLTFDQIAALTPSDMTRLPRRSQRGGGGAPGWGGPEKKSP